MNNIEAERIEAVKEILDGWSRRLSFSYAVEPGASPIKSSRDIARQIVQVLKPEFSLCQKELAGWQLYNFGQGEIADMVMGMAEEVGELAHWVLKRKQRIREAANGGDFKAEIADAFADVVIFGIQVMTCEGIDAEQAIRDTIIEVLARDFKKNPSGKGFSQHKKLKAKEVSNG